MISRRIAPLLLVVFVFTASVLLFSQSAKDTANDLRFHKFQPKVSPDRAVTASSQESAIKGIGVTAAQQMQTLQQDKAARNAAQMKINSNILYTIRMLAGRAVADGVPYLETGIDLDENDNIVVDMVANVSDALLQQLHAAGAQILYTNRAMRSIRAIVPPSQIEAIAASRDVVHIGPKQAFATSRVRPPVGNSLLPYHANFQMRAATIRSQLAMLLGTNVAGTPVTGQGSVSSEGDLTHRAFQARGTFGINGAGLKIGVLSDGVSSLALSQGTQDLPATCNGTVHPCVTVLPGQTGSGDEGTAMMEIIHDMAPGADLYFATADPTITQFAQNIRDLRAAGCDIIVDDVFYFVETPFQDGQAPAVVSPNQAGVVTQAVNDVVAAGAFYFSSAGNEGNLDSGTSGTYEGDFNGAASAAPLPLGGKVHVFGANNFDTVTAAGLQVLLLFWTDPLGASNNDYDLYLLNSAGTAVVAASTDIQNGTQDGIEGFGTAGLVANTRVVVFQKAGAADRFLHVVLFRGGLAVNTAGETHGHSAASGAYTVAATPAAEAFDPINTPVGPFPTEFKITNQIETFSSDGPRQIFFHGDSTAITPGDFSHTGGSVLNKPDITASDGVSVTGVGGFPSPFYGTSASAPSAAAVAALVLSAKPGITAAQMKTALTSTAVDIMNQGFDRNSGSGIVMAFEAVNSLGLTSGNANPELGAVTAVENFANGNGIIEAGEGGKLTIPLKNSTGVKAATGVTATLTTSTTGITIAQPATRSYPNMAAGAGSVDASSPFTFTLASDYPCAQSGDFTLTVNYTGGPQRVLRFSVPLNDRMITINNTLGSAATVPSGITMATGTQTGRISRNGVTSVCGTPKAFPGVVAGNHVFDSYTFTACRAGCLNVELSGPTSINLFESAYSPSFDPTNLSTNYAGDPGFSFGGLASFGISTTAGTPYTIVVNEVGGNTPANTYTLQFPACGLNCNVNHVPVAKAKNVTVTAANTGGTASANVDNGSSDPDGDPLTISQNPPGPYPVGNTNVILSAVDTKGATSQANATVTVNNPEFTIALPTGSATVTRGQSATAQISFAPNPGIGAAMNFACSGLPALATCSFNPPSIPAGSAATNVTMTITTTAPTTAALTTRPLFYATWLPFAGLGLIGMTVMASPKRRRGAALFLTLTLLALVLLAGCGFHRSSSATTSGGTPTGTFAVTVTATSGNVSHSTVFNLTVQ